MAANNEIEERHVVPRWRTFREALANNELSGEIDRISKVFDQRPFLQKKESEWQANKELPFAIDLVSAATMFGASEHSKAAANFILENQKQSSPVAINLASKLLGIEEPKREQTYPVTKFGIIRGLKELKARRISQPSNAFVWVDLARLYVLLGQNPQAEYALKVALTLAPTERFILRSATRFLLHNNERDVALKLLRSNPRTPTDPWLTAAEIAVSSIVKKTPKFAQIGKELIQNSNIKYFHKSELASALAGLEMFHGHDKKANKLFLTSLKEPTENAIAQYVWASRKNGLGIINPELLKVHGASEARTFDANNNAQWPEVVKNAQEWSQSEWFSARPRMVASSVAVYFLNNPELADEFLNEGLRISPGHPGLVNNLAFSLAWNNKTKEAENIIMTLNTDFITPTEAICLAATTGLIFFRSGNPKEGKIFYEKAIASATKIENDTLKYLAELHLAHELFLQADPSGVKEFKRAFGNAIKRKTTNLPFIAEKMASRIMKELIQKPGKNKEHRLL
jgi:tetratricopeptide (TPR) repeat protein